MYHLHKHTTRDENGFEIFRVFENRFRFFPTGFSGNGIFQNRTKSVQPSADRFPRLPILIGIFRNLVSEFSEK
jgi:hypothetical protein